MKIDWFTFAAQIINFLILIYLLKRFLYAPITNAMQQREDRINARLEQATHQQQQAEQLAGEYREKSASLETQRRGLLEQAKTEVDASRKHLLAQAKQEIDHRRQEWLTSLDRERTTLVQTIRQRCGEQVITATRRALLELADSELESQLLRTFLARLASFEGSQDETHELPHSTSASDSSKLKAHREEHEEAKVYTAFELSTESQGRLSEELRRRFPVAEVHFHNEPEIVCGIEVHVGERKIGWSVDEFLATLSEELNRLLENPL